MLEQKSQFKAAFNIRNKRDNRKYQEFANLVRGFARLQGDEQIGIHHVGEAYKIFSKSLTTLTEEFPIKALEYGIDHQLIDIHTRLLAKVREPSTKEEIRKLVKISDRQLEELCQIKAVIRFDSDNTYLVRDFNWDAMEEGA